MLEVHEVADDDEELDRHHDQQRRDRQVAARQPRLGRQPASGIFSGSWDRDPRISPHQNRPRFGRTGKPCGHPFETRFFGDNKTLLTPDTTYNRWPVWSPDDNWIIYTAYGEDGEQEDLFIMTSSGLLKTNLTMHEADDRQAAWQPILVAN